MNTVVIYHARCTDGAGAMWSAWKHFQDDAIYIPVGKNNDRRKYALTKCLQAKRVYMLDVMLDMDDIESLLINNIDVFLLDHHISNIVALKKAKLKRKYPVFLHEHNDIERSGAGIAWDHFNDGPRPIIINYVEDFDLCHWSMPNSENIDVYLSQFNWSDNETIIKIFNELESINPGKMAALGKPLVDYKNQLMVKNIAHIARAKIRIDMPTETSHVATTYDIPILNANQFINETGEFMAQGESFSIIWQMTNDSKIILNLRSDENGEDVSIIAAQLGVKGGGGHKNASGVRFETIQDMLEIITIY